MRFRPHSPARSILRSRKSLGQNFLVDPRVARAIVAAAAPLSDAAVLEIGPGHGALTALLLRAARLVTAVEIDRGLAAEMRERFVRDEFTLIETDILKLDWTTVAPGRGADPDTRVVVVGNLPYNISKPLVMRLVAERRRIARAVLTLQREVVDRLVASPGSRDYGALGILVGRAFEVERLFDVRPGAFRPRPKVISSVVRLTPRAPRELGAAMERALRACLAASFAHRRRTLYNNLRCALPEGDRGARAVLDEARLDGDSRPEAIPPEGFLRLARAWPAEAPRPTRR
jgi:16S rRNA (adenine1518-N6/adenine1519-N6)-dimethyltransferase